MRIKVSRRRRRLPPLAPAAVIRGGPLFDGGDIIFFGRKRTGKCRNKSFR